MVIKGYTIVNITYIYLYHLYSRNFNLIYFQTPIGHHLKQRSLFGLVILTISIIVVFLLCIFLLLHQILNYIQQNESYAYVKQDAETLFKLLGNMSLDKYYCYHCVHVHVTHQKLKQMLQARNEIVQQEKQLRLLRINLNVIGTFTTVHVFFVFGGSMIINITACVTSICTLSALFVDNFQLMISIESSIIVCSTIVTCKSIYCLVVAIFQIILRTAQKAQ